MTIKELKAEIADLPDEWPIVMVCDPEGNGFYQVRDAVHGRWNKVNGEYVLFELTDELKAQGYGADDVDESLPPALFLWP